MSPWLNWIERWPPEPKVAGSNPAGDACTNKHLQQSIDEKAQKSAVLGAEPRHISVELATIIKIWPDLPEHIKAAIKALVQTHNSKGAKP